MSDLGSRIGGLVQQLNTVHNLFQQQKYEDAHKALSAVIAKAKLTEHDLWLKYRPSGVGK